MGGSASHQNVRTVGRLGPSSEGPSLGSVVSGEAARHLDHAPPHNLNSMLSHCWGGSTSVPKVSARAGYMGSFTAGGQKTDIPKWADMRQLSSTGRTRYPSEAESESTTGKRKSRVHGGGGREGGGWAGGGAGVGEDGGGWGSCDVRTAARAAKRKQRKEKKRKTAQMKKNPFSWPF